MKLDFCLNADGDFVVAHDESETITGFFRLEKDGLRLAFLSGRVLDVSLPPEFTGKTKPGMTALAVRIGAGGQIRTSRFFIAGTTE